MKNDLTVIDFFCGAGGFSEGFREQGFKIVRGEDNWEPAIKTHNLNHSLYDKTKDVLDYEGSIDEIDRLPNTDIIIGSPPCVSFSMSNKAGKANKSLGIRLIEAYLRVITVKKHRPNSVLKAWLMENVPNSRNFVKEHYTFDDLDLHEWAKNLGKDPKSVALEVKNKGGLLCAADYGSPQSRVRFVCGEIIATGIFPFPEKTHEMIQTDQMLKKHIALVQIKNLIPLPTEIDREIPCIDPNYPTIKIPAYRLTDHFYDTGVYQIEWEKAYLAKTNHPFMGRMSFPEDENRPSRTIMATRSASTREAILYRSEYTRKGDGEYRLPTIREAATLMGFPFVYQFTGSEATKWRLIGNAVCPHMAFALAKQIATELGYRSIPRTKISFSKLKENYNKVEDLNSYEEKIFDRPPSRGKNAKFRMHPFKDGNMTVALTNFDPNTTSTEYDGNWYGFIFLGSGKDYSTHPITKHILDQSEKLIQTRIMNGKDFIDSFRSDVLDSIPPNSKWQDMYETNRSRIDDFISPSETIKDLASRIKKFTSEIKAFDKYSLIGFRKENIPLDQLMAIWCIGTIVNHQKRP